MVRRHRGAEAIRHAQCGCGQTCVQRAGHPVGDMCAEAARVWTVDRARGRRLHARRPCGAPVVAGETPLITGRTVVQLRRLPGTVDYRGSNNDRARPGPGRGRRARGRRDGLPDLDQALTTSTVEGRDDLGVQADRHGVTADRLDRGRQLDAAAVQHRAAGGLDRVDDVGRGDRAEQPAALARHGLVSVTDSALSWAATSLGLTEVADLADLAGPCGSRAICFSAPRLATMARPCGTR